MLKTVYASEGKKFCLTEVGFEIGRIRTKFDHTGNLYKQYEKVVPKVWVEKGYVKEVDK